MNNSNWNTLLVLALAGRDKSTAQMAIKHIGKDWDAYVWQEKKFFDQVVVWVNSQ